MLPQVEDRLAPRMGQDGFFEIFTIFCNLVRLFIYCSFPTSNIHICPQCENIKYKLKLFNGVFLRRAALHTFMSAYAKVNSLNIKGSKNTYLVYYYVHHVDMLFSIPMWQGRAAFCTISLSVHGPHEIATRAAVGPWAAGCRPLAYNNVLPDSLSWSIGLPPLNMVLTWMLGKLYYL